MTNTYPNEADNDIKIAEELRLIRCTLERLLRHYAPEEFVDYQMEKFGKSFKFDIRKYILHDDITAEEYKRLPSKERIKYWEKRLEEINQALKELGEFNG